jgi:hypothetical protein
MFQPRRALGPTILLVAVSSCFHPQAAARTAGARESERFGEDPAGPALALRASQPSGPQGHFNRTKSCGPLIQIPTILRGTPGGFPRTRMSTTASG